MKYSDEQIDTILAISEVLVVDEAKTPFTIIRQLRAELAEAKRRAVERENTWTLHAQELETNTKRQAERYLAGIERKRARIAKLHREVPPLNEHTMRSNAYISACNDTIDTVLAILDDKETVGD